MYDFLYLLLFPHVPGCCLWCSCWLISGELLVALGEDGVLLFLKLDCRHPSQLDKSDISNVQRLMPVQTEWRAEPIGFTRTPERLERLMWERQHLLFGVASDAALLLLSGLHRLNWESREQQKVEDATSGIRDNSEYPKCNEEIEDDVGGGPAELNHSIDTSSDHSGGGSTHYEGSDADDTDTEIFSQGPSTSDARSTTKDPLDLSDVLFFRQGNTAYLAGTFLSAGCESIQAAAIS